MRYFQLLLLCFLCVVNSYGQTGKRFYGSVQVEITIEKRPQKIYAKVVEVTPAFPGGDSSWAQTLENNINRSLTVKKKAKAGKYIVSARFLVERDGSIADVACLKDPGFGMCEQVVGALKRQSRGWRPIQSPDTTTRSNVRVRN
jgi:hypothetical protein